MAKLAIAVLVIFAMMLFRRRLPEMIAVFLFIFIMPDRLFHIFGISRFTAAPLLAFLRWAVYLGLIILGIIYNQKSRIRKIILPDIFMIFFIVLVSFSAMVSIKPGITIQRGVSVILMYFALFFGVYSYIDDIRKIYKICGAMLIFIIAYNIMSCIPGIGLRFAQGRLTGLSGYPTGTAGINAFILPIALMAYLIKRTKRNLLIIIFILTIAYLTYTRTSFIAMSLSLALFYSQYLRKTKVMFAFMTVSIFATIFISFFTFGIWFPEKLVRVESLPILGGRLQAWYAARNIIAMRPLYGYGFGTEQFLLSEFDLDVGRHAGLYFHNSFLGLAAQIGILFALIFFAALAYFTFSIVNFTAKIKDEKQRLLGITLSTILFVGFLYCFAESWIYSAGNILSFIYFTVIVLIIRFRKLIKEQA